jgi:hypothetical protein
VSRASVALLALLAPLVPVGCEPTTDPHRGGRVERGARDAGGAATEEAREGLAAREVTEGACTPAVSDKLGVPFVRICPDELPEGVIPAPFWISAAPLGCSVGDHGAISCPEVVPLSRPPVPPRRAALLDAATAHALCLLRFGGRLPTAAERARAGDARGLETVAVSAWTGPDRYALQRVAEWVTAAPCEQISVHAGCDVDRFPADGLTAIDWEHLRECRAQPAPAGSRAVVPVGGECAAAAATDAGPAPAGSLPCLVAPSSPAGPAAALRFALTCEAPAADDLDHPEAPPLDVAAVRCVLPAGAIVGPVR